MMDQLETLCTRLAQDGYHAHLNHWGLAWECTLGCSVDIMPGNLPRPRATRPTALEAVQAAAAMLERKAA